MQPHELDQLADVGLRMAQRERSPMSPQPLRQAGEVDHQRRIREVQLGHVDDHVAGRAECGGEGTPTAPARRAVLVPRNAQNPELFVEGDDSREPRQIRG